VEGVVSTNGEVLVFTGRAAGLELLGVGTRAAGGMVSQAELEGRWLAVDLGVHLRDEGTEPFSTRWVNRFRTFTVDATGALTYDPSGTVFSTDVTYRTDQVPPVHTRSAASTADGGSESLFVSFQGGVSSTAGDRTGWLAPAAGMLASHRFDDQANALELSVAVRQPATAGALTFLGDYRFARLDVGAAVEEPPGTTSRGLFLPVLGTLAVDAGGNATLSDEAAEQADYALTGEPPSAAMTWTLARTLVQVPGGSLPFALELDAAGNHTPAGAARWFGVSGDGTVVLGAAPGDGLTLFRSLFVGLR